MQLSSHYFNEEDDEIEIIPVPPKKKAKTEVIEIDVSDSDLEEETRPKVVPNPFHVADTKCGVSVLAKIAEKDESRGKEETGPDCGDELPGRESEEDDPEARSVSTTEESSGVEDVGKDVDPSFTTRCKGPDEPTPLRWRTKANAKAYPEADDTPPGSPRPSTSTAPPGSPKSSSTTAAERFSKREKFPRGTWRQVLRTTLPQDIAEAAILTLENKKCFDEDTEEDENSGQFDDIEEDETVSLLLKENPTEESVEPAVTTEQTPLLKLRFIVLNEPADIPAEAPDTESGIDEEEPNSDLNMDNIESTVVDN